MVSGRTSSAWGEVSKDIRPTQYTPGLQGGGVLLWHGRDFEIRLTLFTLGLITLNKPPRSTWASLSWAKASQGPCVLQTLTKIRSFCKPLGRGFLLIKESRHSNNLTVTIIVYDGNHHTIKVNITRSSSNNKKRGFHLRPTVCWDAAEGKSRAEHKAERLAAQQWDHLLFKRPDCARCGRGAVSAIEQDNRKRRGSVISASSMVMAGRWYSRDPYYGWPKHADLVSCYQVILFIVASQTNGFNSQREHSLCFLRQLRDCCFYLVYSNVITQLYVVTLTWGTRSVHIG